MRHGTAGVTATAVREDKVRTEPDPKQLSRDAIKPLLEGAGAQLELGELMDVVDELGLSVAQCGGVGELEGVEVGGQRVSAGALLGVEQAVVPPVSIWCW